MTHLRPRFGPEAALDIEATYPSPQHAPEASKYVSQLSRGRRSGSELSSWLPGPRGSRARSLQAEPAARRQQHPHPEQQQPHRPLPRGRARAVQQPRHLLPCQHPAACGYEGQAATHYGYEVQAAPNYGADAASLSVTILSFNRPLLSGTQVVKRWPPSTMVLTTLFDERCLISMGFHLDKANAQCALNSSTSTGHPR